MVLDDGNIELPIRFTAEKSGHYPCKITLETADDIRVYQVECTVSPPGSRLVYSSLKILILVVGSKWHAGVETINDIIVTYKMDASMIG